jgi:tRNA (guanine-N7-)-methyltransferase
MTRGPRLRPEPAGQEFVGLTTPPNWDQVFGFAGPLELEIGCGAGGFALEYARRFPKVRFIAFEWRKKFARSVHHKAELAELKNLRVIEGDARFEIPRLFTPGSLAQIHLQFPDPWWKRSHHKRAILTPEFTGFLLDLLETGGRFDLRTDVEDRASWMLETLESAGFTNPLGKGQFHPYDPEEVPSSREHRYLETGQPVFRARLVKAPGTPPSPPRPAGSPAPKRG